MSRVFSVLALAALSGCISGKPDDTASSDDTGPGAHLGTCEAEDGHGTTINSVAVSGDTLQVNVSYGGGCEEHFFTLCWPDQSFMESDPVQVNLELLHTGPMDACDAWLTEDLSFDLEPLKTAWQSGYGGGSGTITVHLGGQTVTYTF